MANSSILVLPNITKPASLQFSTTCASYGEIKLSSILEPQVVLTPLVQKISFCAMGTPVKGPASPLAILASAARACSSACSRVIVTKALRSLSLASSRSSKFVVSSSLEYSRACKPLASSARLLLCMGLPILDSVANSYF